MSKITELTELAVADLADDDLLLVRDTSTNTDKKINGAVINTKQSQTLATPLTIGGILQTFVEDALGGLNALIPSDASSSNKLATKAHKSGVSDADNCTDEGIYDNVNNNIPQQGLSYTIDVKLSSDGIIFQTAYKNQIGDTVPFVAVRKKATNSAWSDWQLITPTSSVTSGSTVPVTSGGVYDALSNKINGGIIQGIRVSENEIKFTFKNDTSGYISCAFLDIVGSAYKHYVAPIIISAVDGNFNVDLGQAFNASSAHDVGTVSVSMSGNVLTISNTGRNFGATIRYLGRNGI